MSELERLRRGPTRVSGTALVAALERITELAGLGVGDADLSVVPPRRAAELARYGLTGKAPALRRHGYARKLATLLSTVVMLEARATDDALELFDVLMTTELMGRAERESSKEKLRRFPRLSRDAARCAAAVEVLLEAVEWGDGISVEVIWDAIESRVSRAELRTAVANLAQMTPPPEADPHGEWRAKLVDRYKVVARFVPLLVKTIRLEATAEAAPVLYALQGLPELMAARATKQVPAGFLDARHASVDVVPPGWWRPPVFAPGRPEGTVDRAAYVFCVLELFHQRLKRRDIFAVVSSRWADPRAQLLTGPAWEATRGPVLDVLRLPEQPDGLLDAYAGELDAAWRHVAARLAETVDADAEVRIDADGRLSLFEERDGWRYTAFVTNTTTGALQWLEARHRAHARVEDRIRCAKDTGLRRLPSREFAINTAWCQIAAMACDLIAWLQLLTLDGDLAKAEPKRLRYRLLHTAARLVRGQRRRRLRIPPTWPWANQITAAFTRIAAIPAPG